MVQLEAVKLMEQEFNGGEFPATELGERWMRVIRPLQEQPLKDADRAGELLDVCPATDDGGGSHKQRFTLGIVGSKTGTVYGRPQLILYGDDLKGADDNSFWLYMAASLTAAINGPSRFSDAEKDALMSILGSGGIHCDFCDKGFPFYEDALAHEQTCPRRDNPAKISCEC